MADASTEWVKKSVPNPPILEKLSNVSAFAGKTDAKPDKPEVQKPFEFGLYIPKKGPAPEGTPWAHLDIAGPFIRDKEWKYYEAGAIGFGTKTLVDLAERFTEYGL